MQCSKNRLFIIISLSFFLGTQCTILAPVPTDDSPRDKAPSVIIPKTGEQEEASLPPKTEVPKTDPVIDRPKEPESNKTNSRPTREMELRFAIIDYAKTFLGTNYLYAGRKPETGFDCSGFTFFVMKKYDIELSPSSRMQEDQGKKISINKVKAGDLIFYRRSADTPVFHVSLVIENDNEGIKVIHSTNRGVVIDNISTNSWWNPKISSARDVVSGQF